MRYKFKDISHLNERSSFANNVCLLLVEKYEGDFIKAIKELKDTNIYNYFFEHVRNIYELVDTEIPLFCLYELLKEDRITTINNFDFESDGLDFDNVICDVTKACVDYYIKLTPNK